MAGLISSMQPGFGAARPIPPRQVIYNNQNDHSSFGSTIERVEAIQKMPSIDRIRDQTRFEASLIPERKPNHFYQQQDRIISWRPPIYNDVYHLDVEQVRVPLESSTFHNQPIVGTEFRDIRDPFLVEIGRPGPRKIETRFVDSHYSVDRPTIELYENRRNVNSNRVVNGMNKNLGRQALNTRPNLIEPNRPSSLQMTNRASIPANARIGNTSIKRIESEHEPHLITRQLINPKFAIY